MNDQRLTAKQAVQYIQSRTPISEPGKYTLQVIGANVHAGKVILNLKAQDPKGTELAKEHLRAGEYDAAANTNMSTNVFEDASFIPSKGDFIHCMVAEVPTRDGGFKLGVTNISEIKAKNVATKVSLGDEFANLLEDVVAEEATETTTDMPNLG